MKTSNLLIVFAVFFLAIFGALSWNCFKVLSLGENLNAAASAGDLSSVKRLLREGANIDFQLEDGSTALMDAAGASQIEVVKFLLDNDADPSLRNHQGFTAEERAWRKDIKHLIRQYSPREKASSAK